MRTVVGRRDIAFANTSSASKVTKMHSMRRRPSRPRGSERTNLTDTNQQVLLAGTYGLFASPTPWMK
jgi:hypothetical protein